MDDATRSKFLLYREKVRKFSEKNFRNNYIENKELRGKYYELDHKYSIYEGFIHEIPESIIADVSNLHVIPREENRQKSSNSSITFEELINEISERDELI